MLRDCSGGGGRVHERRCIIRPVVINAVGEPGIGKTHLIMTCPPPIVIFDFDGGTEDAIGAFPDKEIDIRDYTLPVQWSSKKRTYGQKEWQDFLTDYLASLEEYETIGIDTGTTLWGVNRIAYREELGQKELLAVQYGEPNARMDAVVASARKARKNLVLTHHIRPVYVDDKRTGEVEPDGYSHMDDKVDISLRMQLKPKTKKEPTVSQTMIAKCRLGRNMVGDWIEDIDYELLADLVDSQ